MISFTRLNRWSRTTYKYGRGTAQVHTTDGRRVEIQFHSDGRITATNVGANAPEFRVNLTRVIRWPESNLIHAHDRFVAPRGT